MNINRLEHALSQSSTLENPMDDDYTVSTIGKLLFLHYSIALLILHPIKASSLVAFGEFTC